MDETIEVPKLMGDLGRARHCVALVRGGARWAEYELAEICWDEVILDRYYRRQENGVKHMEG